MSNYIVAFQHLTHVLTARHRIDFFPYRLDPEMREVGRTDHRLTWQTSLRTWLSPGVMMATHARYVPHSPFPPQLSVTSGVGVTELIQLAAHQWSKNALNDNTFLSHLEAN